MDKLEEITRKRKHAHAKLQALGSKVYEALLKMEDAAFADGALPRKTKELIAVGISVKIDCESCMQWHIEQAARAGCHDARDSRGGGSGNRDGRGPGHRLGSLRTRSNRAPVSRRDWTNGSLAIRILRDIACARDDEDAPLPLRR